MSIANRKQIRIVAADAPPPPLDPDAQKLLESGLTPETRIVWNGLTERRKARLWNAARTRMLGSALALESVWNPHNQAAVIRTCDGLGIPELARCGTEPFAPHSEVAKGAHRWVTRREFPTVTELAADYRARGARLLVSELDPAALPLSEYDLTTPVVLLLGNEHEGISPAAKSAADGLFFLPMTGLVQSYNISVAAAMAGYELRRQRESAGVGLTSPVDDAITRLLGWLEQDVVT